MNLKVSDFENGKLLSEATAEELLAVTGGANAMLFDFKALTGVMFADNGIWYMKGDGNWVQVTKPK